MNDKKYNKKKKNIIKKGWKWENNIIKSGMKMRK